MKQEDLNNIKTILDKAIKMQWFELAILMRDAKKLLEKRLKPFEK